MNCVIEHRNLSIDDLCFHVAVSRPVGRVGRPAPLSRGPVFCLHGFPEGWLGWRPLMRQLPDVACYAPDLRGYPISDYPDSGYDIFTLTDDIRQLMDALDLERPLLLGHDWGGALGWLFAHRFPDRISRLVVVNCTHPRTLVRAVLRFRDLQTLRIPWVPPFQVPWLPEALLTTAAGRKLLELSFTLRAGSRGQMDHDLVREIVQRFARAEDMRGPINYYRAFVRTLLHGRQRTRLDALYQTPIQVPVSLVWGLEDRALSARVAQDSEQDAGCPVEWRPLAGIGHFVDLEAPELLAAELDRLLQQATPSAVAPSRPITVA
ncbi:alpha/beta fold hydrolase [Marinobacter sp. SS21]|uniref:alpha/beta fold hydrolase n=1 Tax=Marinobacter sp. SS21 TaxID=2979460 RepID=UPI00232E1A15|nr:alpha/beta hydrolase [Marinobacter sp. SS21]MDC0664124.1 alpha/beta hydrolase [Marinobacter sp. SS21]